MSTVSFSGTDWGKFAAEYAKLMENGPTIPLIHALLDSIDAMKPFQSAQAIVDVGCGPGVAIKELFDVYGSRLPPSASLAASDVSQGMVEQVRNLQAAHAGSDVWDRLETYVWDLQDLQQVEHESYSHIIANLVFFAIARPRQALKEVHRVLQKDGVIGLSTVSRAEWMEVIEAATQAVRPDLAASKPRFVLPKEWTTTEAVSKELEESGFMDVQAKYVNMKLSVDDPGLLKWLLRTSNPAMVRMTVGFSEEDLHRADAEMERIIDERCPTSPKTLEGIMVVAVGRRK